MNPLEKREIGKTGLKISRLGLGGSSLGGLYNASSESDAIEVISAFRELGLNHIDTAPSYGYGLSEKRIGKALRNVPRDQFVLSTKIGELLVTDGTPPPTSIFKEVDGRSLVRDYSRDGVLKSLESSLSRLMVDHIDILYIHDAYRERADKAISEAFPALDELRSSGVIKAIGVGMDDTAILTRFARECDVDCFLTFSSYSFFNTTALDELFPLCEKKGISIIQGSPFESGILASDLSGEQKYRYHSAPDEVLEKARDIELICRRYGVPLKAAALQYVLRHPIIVSTIPGTKSAARLRENFSMIQHPIPEEMWDELKADSYIREAPAAIQTQINRG
jgi:D-threo-aldose 1-dehydrogenase